MQSKEYKLPNGKTAVFEYDACGIGKITIECMDELMAMIADRPQGEWVVTYTGGIKQTECSACGVSFTTYDVYGWNFCPWCGAQMKGADDGADNI